MPSTKSRVHPKYKTKYRVSNWAEYDLSLVERGNLTIWLSSNAIARWNAKPSRRRGEQRKYSDLASEAALPTAGPRVVRALPKSRNGRAERI